MFVLADDLGYADIGCYGRPDIATPSIDRLAVNGVRFLQAYANSAVCTATRTALITGRYQYRLRVGLEEPLNTTTAAAGASGDPAHPFDGRSLLPQIADSAPAVPRTLFWRYVSPGPVVAVGL